MIRVAIADDHQIVLEGLVQLLTGEEDIEVVGQVLDGGQLIALLQRTPADVVLVDIDMPYMNGIQACKKIKVDFPGTAVVALTMIAEASIIRKMLEAGASGYLMKNTGKQELMRCLRIVSEGGSYYSEEVGGIILSDLTGKNKDTQKVYPRLSRREKEILQLIADEMTTGATGATHPVCLEIQYVRESRRRHGSGCNYRRWSLGTDARQQRPGQERQDYLRRGQHTHTQQGGRLLPRAQYRLARRPRFHSRRSEYRCRRLRDPP